jgi:ABC-type nitrate/sulfonate/bicarbonate transport system substrate-binding protein
MIGGVLRKIAVPTLLAGVMLALGLDSAEAQEPKLIEVTVSVFPGGFNWPSYVAQDNGLFAQQGIQVTLQDTPGSVAQMTGLSQGRFDLAMTAIDNIVAYVEGEGEAPIGPQPDFVAVMGSDSSFLSLVTTAEIKSYADLRGRTLSVDARTTGFAFVLYDMLARKGLSQSDYTVEPAGGMTQRWSALEQHAQAGTLLSTPFNILARDAGFNQMATATDVIGPYQGIVAATRRSWAHDHRAQVVGFIRAYAQAVDWLYDPKNRDAAIRILTKNVPGISPDLAEKTYAELLDPHAGFFREGRMSIPGVRTVLALRTRYAVPHKVLNDPMKYYDPSFYRAAMR